MPRITWFSRAAALSFPFWLAFGASGCAMDDVQFNGGLFDAVGLSDAARANSKSEPKVAARRPLVVPPSLDRLPQPGSEQAPEIAGIKDPDAEKVISKKEKERLQAEYCEVHYERPKTRGEIVDHVNGPHGPCRKSVLTNIKNFNKSDE